MNLITAHWSLRRAAECILIASHKEGVENDEARLFLVNEAIAALSEGVKELGATVDIELAKAA